MSGKRTNWAGNYTYAADSVSSPQNQKQIAEQVAQGHLLKALGTRHAFSAIADTRGIHLDLDKLNQVMKIDPERMRVSVESNIRYGELSAILQEQGFALNNLASLPHLSVAGACATGTHGSGMDIGNLATQVTDLSLIRADGENVTLSRDSDGEQFYGTVIHLGGLGIVTELTLEMVPTFNICQRVYENLAFHALEQNFDAVFTSAYSVSLFTDWKNDRFNQAWLKHKTTGTENLSAEGSWFDATPARGDRHPLQGMDPNHCSRQMGVSCPWNQSLPHFRMEYTPSFGEELQTEYLVPYPNAVDALQALRRMKDAIHPHLLICEIRVIAADHLWMSPCYKQHCIGIHFTWKQEWDAVKKLLPVIEAELMPFHARPHWGKLFTMSPRYLNRCYSRLEEFKYLMRNFDPEGKFRNGFLDWNLFQRVGLSRG